MRHKYFKITYIIGLLVLSLSISITFAAFIFNQTANVRANLGQVEVSSKSFYKYNLYDTEQTDSRKNKLRKDSVYLIDNITIGFVDGYKITDDEDVQSGKKYYESKTLTSVSADAAFDVNFSYYSLSDGKYEKLDLTADTFNPSSETYYCTDGDFKKAITSSLSGPTFYTRTGEAEPYKYSVATGSYSSSETYYILLKDKNAEVGTSASGLYEYTKTYDDIKTAKAYAVSGNDLVEKNVSISSNSITIKEANDSTLITASCTLDTENGVVSSVTLSNYGNNDYRATIDYKGLGIYILDNSITNSASGYEEAKDDENKVLDSIICSASETKYDSDGKVYLSQLGLHFKFYTEIAVYIRIHIQDAWIRTRKFSATNIRRQYIMKDQIEGKSPFAVNDDEWFFDEKENCIYLKNRYVPEAQKDNSGNPVLDANGKYIYPEKEYTFNINEGYYYDVLKSISYTDYIDVQVSFTVDIVQANRAYALWGFDPSDRDYIEG